MILCYRTNRIFTRETGYQKMSGFKLLLNQPFHIWAKEFLQDKKILELKFISELGSRLMKATLLKPNFF